MDRAAEIYRSIRRGSRLQHVQVRVRVTVDPELWAEAFDTERERIPDDVRRYVVELLRESGAARTGLIVAARRDGL
jgi:hypothetical protein